MIAPSVNRPTGQRPRATGEAGFATLFVLLLAMAACVLLTAAIQMNYQVHDQNRRQLRDLQVRAEKLQPVITRPNGEKGRAH